MKCIICGSTISSKSKKCATCGAAANISRGGFLFEFGAEDQKQLSKHYNAWKEKEAKSTASATTSGSTETEKITIIGTTKHIQPLYPKRYSAEEWYANGQHYLTHGIYENAADEFKHGANLGHAPSQYEYAKCYATGVGVTKNEGTAFMFYNKAAKQGHIKAQRALAECYENGVGTDVNIQVALRWYKKASEGGDEISRAALERLGETSREYRASAEQNSWIQAVPYEHGSSISTIRFTGEARSALSRERNLPSSRARMTFRERMTLLWSGITRIFAVILVAVPAIIMGFVPGFMGMSLVKGIADEIAGRGSDISIPLVALVLILITGGLLFLYRLLIIFLDNIGVLNTTIRCELIIVPILVVVLFVGGAIAVEKYPSLKYTIADYKLEYGMVYDARRSFEELGDYEDSKQRIQEIVAMYPTAMAVGDIILFGEYEQDNNPDNGKEPIEWRVVSGNNGQYVTLISEKTLDYKYFDRNYWENSSLRGWLNNDFSNEAFSEQERAVLDRSDGFGGDIVDIWLAVGKNIPDEIKKSAPSQYAQAKGSEEFTWCFRETEKIVYPARNANTQGTAYVDSIGKVTSGVSEGSFYIRPVIRLRANVYESVLGYNDEPPCEWYGTDFSVIEKTFVGSYSAGQGITGVNLTIISCDEYGNIEAEFNFYEHYDNPGVPSGKFLMRGNITNVDEDGNINIVMNGYKWINRPGNYNMLDFYQIIIDNQHKHLTGSYQIDATAY